MQIKLSVFAVLSAIASSAMAAPLVSNATETSVLDKRVTHSGRVSVVLGVICRGNSINHRALILRSVLGLAVTIMLTATQLSLSAAKFMAMGGTAIK